MTHSPSSEPFVTKNGLNCGRVLVISGRFICIKSNIYFSFTSLQLFIDFFDNHKIIFRGKHVAVIIFIIFRIVFKFSNVCIHKKNSQKDHCLDFFINYSLYILSEFANCKLLKSALTGDYHPKLHAIREFDNEHLLI